MSPFRLLGFRLRDRAACFGVNLFTLFLTGTLVSVHFPLWVRLKVLFEISPKWCSISRDLSALGWVPYGDPLVVPLQLPNGLCGGATGKLSWEEVRHSAARSTASNSLGRRKHVLIRDDLSCAFRIRLWLSCPRPCC